MTICQRLDSAVSSELRLLPLGSELLERDTTGLEDRLWQMRQTGCFRDRRTKSCPDHPELDESHKQIDSRWALQRALEGLMAAGNKGDKAIYVIEALAAYLFEHYEVRGKDRRDNTERRIAPGSNGEAASR